MLRFTKPETDEYREYFATYLAHLDPDQTDVMDLLRDQGLNVLCGLKRISDSQLRHKYAPGKWSVGEEEHGASGDQIQFGWF